MGYIKKLKNNELVGGTDKTTIYPVTSTKAVFEEITNGNESSFKSQETINGEHDGRIKGLENEMPDTVKSITINGGTKTYLPEDGNVELTIYSEGGEDYPGIAEAVQNNTANITAIQNEIGTDTTEDTLSGRIKNLENAVGTGGSVDQKISDAIGNINAEHSDTNPTDHIQYQVVQSGGEITNFTIQGVDIASADALSNLSDYVESIYQTKTIAVENRPTTGEGGIVYRVPNSGGTTYTDWMYDNNNNSWVELATFDVSNIDSDNVGYDNSQSGLDADNVQDALDEIGEDLSVIVGGDVTYTKADCTLYGTINGSGHITEETTSNWLLSPWIELPNNATTIVYSGSVNLSTAKGMALYASNAENTFIHVFTASGTINLEDYPTAKYMRIMSHTTRSDSNINVVISYNGKMSEIDVLNNDMNVLKGQFHTFFPSEEAIVGEVGYYWNVTTIGLRKASNNNNWYWHDYIDVRKLVGTSIKLSLTDLSYTWIVFEDDTYVKATTLSPTTSGNYKVFTIPQNAAKLCVSWAYNWTTSGDITKVLYAHEGLGSYDELVEQVDELVSMSDSVSDKVSVNNSDCLLLMGSSLTAAITMPAGYNWADKLNDLLDIPVVNGGHGGNNMLGNIAEVANAGSLYVDSGLNFSEFNKTYILWGNSANGTVDGINGYKALDMAELITKRYGAEIIIGSEEPFGGNAGRYAESQWAKAHNVPYMIAQKILEKTLMHTGSGYYGGWIWQGHRGWRGMGAYVNAYMDLMRELPIINSVKMYKVRDKFLSSMSSVNDLVYDNNTERLYKFHAADAGSTVNMAFTTSSTFNGADNLNDASYNITGSTISSVNSSLTGRMLAGKAISFTGYALIEMVLNVHSLTKFSFSCGCSVTPSNVYLIKCPTSNFPTTLSAYNSKIESVPFTYEGNEVKFELSEFDGVLLYDKVRILINCSSSFNLINPQATYAGQRKKVGKYVNYQQRKNGTELRTNTGMVAADWTLSGASIISFPTGVKCYTRYNDVEAVLKLGSNSDTATTVVTHTTGKRVAIRIVAQNFFKWMTTRYSGSEYTDYVADSPQLGAYEYDYGKLYLTINDKYGQVLLVPCGWAELYTEVDCDDESNLTIKLQRANESGIYSSANTPIYIHDLSVQEIND